MGVLKQELSEKNLLIMETLPDSGKKDTTLKQMLAAEPEKAEEGSNEIGLYISCELGLAFTEYNLIQMILSYRNFRNSVMIVYDINKSAVGLNPLACYRLSDVAIDTLFLNDLAKITD